MTNKLDLEAQSRLAAKLVRIDITRTTSVEGAEVRVFVAGVKEPHIFQFETMAAAIEFYEDLWSHQGRRGGPNGKAQKPDSDS